MFAESIAVTFRRVLRRPGLALAGALTLAVGIGATVAVFSVLKGVVLDPLPFPDADRLVHLFRNQPPISYGPTSREAYLELTGDDDVNLQLAGYAWSSYTLSDASDSARVFGTEVDAGFFEALGLQPALGRLLDVSDQSPDAPLAAVISHRLWQDRYAGSRDVLGRDIRLNGELHTIVGVAHADLDLPSGADVWRPARFATSGGNGNYIFLFARLGEGMSATQAGEWASRHAERWAQQNPGAYGNLSFRAVGFADWQTRGVRDNLWLVFGAVVLVLLIACGNVANLQLTHTLARTRDIATHAALGARRHQLAAAAIGESLVVALLGLGGGLLLAWAGIYLLRQEAIGFMPRVEDIRMDAGVVLFAAAVALITALLSGALPAAFARRVNLADSLRSGSKEGSGGGQRWRKALVVGELAMCMSLVVAALLLITSIHKLASVDPGFDPANLLSARVVIAAEPGQESWEAYAQQQQRLLAALESELAALPGVVSAGVIDTLPVTGRNNWNGTIAIHGQEYPDGRGPTVEYRFVTADYFETIGLQLLQGRGFSAQESGPPKALVNRAFVERLLGDGDVLGRRVNAVGVDVEIVGVVSNARQWSLHRDADPEMYFLYGQTPAPNQTTLLLRTAGEPLALAPLVRDAVRRIAPDVPVFGVSSMDAIVERSYAQQSFVMRLLLAFGAVALVIACVGLYAVLAYIVSQRTREIGVQLALGATGGRVLSNTLREGALLASGGVLAGAGLALVAGKLLQGLVFGVTFYEPAIYAAAGIVLALVALSASLLPAWRAARVNPMDALRYE